MSTSSATIKSSSLSPDSKAKALRVLREAAKARGLLKDNAPLWPPQYCQRHAGSAWKFIQELQTWNEAESEYQIYPQDKPYLRRITREWVRCWRKGQPLVIEKSRRLVTSWLLRALELWIMGLKPCEGVVTHLTNDDASEHVWRIWHLYDDLRRRKPSWKLAAAIDYGSLADKKLDAVILPNGSKAEKHFEKPEGLQGSGFAFVTMEEISLYRRPSNMWAQAKFVTQSSAGAVNGLRVAVTNASPNEDWHEIKCKESARKLLGLE